MDKEFLGSFNQINKELKKNDKSLKNRLQSIILDNKFLEEQVLPTFPNFPVIPNERCGLWYCNPSRYSQTSYFKSTDGHINQWDFSTRRLNFHLLPTLIENDGIIIVDSTRRGKKIPDALSKTVPIWCAVLNCLMVELSGSQVNYDELLFVPPGTVTKSERDRMVKKLPELVNKLQILNIFDGKKMHEAFQGRLLRPFWVYPGSPLLESNVDPFTGEILNVEEWQVPKEENIVPIILCTISYQVQDGIDKRPGFTYVQGAADDHELWSHGLEPDMFWSNFGKFYNIEAGETELENIVNDIINEKLSNVSLNETGDLKNSFTSIDEINADLTLATIIDGLMINNRQINSLKDQFSLVLILSENVTLEAMYDKDDKIDVAKFISFYPLSSGSKKSSKELRGMFPDIDRTVSSALKNIQKPILICCNTGKDMSIGVLLMLLSKYYDLDWNLCGDYLPSISKITIRKHLTKLIEHLQGRNVNPSRATLNSVNSYLM